MFSIGGGSLISRMLGDSKPETTKKVCSLSFYGSIFVALLYSVLCLIFMEPLLNLLGVSKYIVGYAASILFGSL